MTDRLVDFILCFVKPLVHAFEVAVAESSRKIFHHVHCVTFILLAQLSQKSIFELIKFSLAIFTFSLGPNFVLYLQVERQDEELDRIERNWESQSKISRSPATPERSSPGAISRYSSEEHERTILH